MTQKHMLYSVGPKLTHSLWNIISTKIIIKWNLWWLVGYINANIIHGPRTAAFTRVRACIRRCNGPLTKIITSLFEYSLFNYNYQICNYASLCKPLCAPASTWSMLAGAHFDWCTPMPISWHNYMHKLIGLAAWSLTTFDHCRLVSFIFMRAKL